MKLIGSRSLGIHNENSDYDYVVIEEGDGNWEDITNERLGNRRHCYHYPKGYRDRISMFNIEQDDYHWMHNAEDYMLGVIDINPFDYREEWVKRMNLDCPEIRTPDACIFLDLTPDESLERISKGRATTEIYETKEKLTAVRNKFLSVLDELGGENPDEHIHIISAFGDVETVAKRISAAADEIIG